LLPAGRDVNDQRNVSAFPSTSDDAPPFNVTRCPTRVVASGPALATGAEFAVDTSTTSGSLSRKPSLTLSSIRNVPALSSCSEGRTAFGSDNVALLS
jgi:hypothetical protein